MSHVPGVPPDLPAVILDADDRLDADLPCVHCGYNLRGLLLAQACPECGAAIGRSVKGDLLCFADPAWVGTLARGAKLMLLAIIVGVLGSLSLLATSGSTGDEIGSTAFALALGALNLYACWLFTRAEPAAHEPEVGVSARIVARWGQVVAVAGDLAGLLMGLIDEAAGGAVSDAAQPLYIVSWIGAGLWAIRLARRVPDLRLARQIRIVMWGLGICLSVGLLAVFADLGAMPIAGPGGAARSFLPGGACALALGLLVFALWSVVLLARMSQALRAAADQARATWAAEAPVTVASA